MYRLTDKRLTDAKTILENYRTKLFSKKCFDAPAFELELRNVWDIGYQEMKSVIYDVLKNERYSEVAVWYMEHSNSGSGVAAEFKETLASVYGAKSFDAGDRKELQKKFWADIFESNKS